MTTRFEYPINKEWADTGAKIKLVDGVFEVVGDNETKNPLIRYVLPSSTKSIKLVIEIETGDQE